VQWTALGAAVVPEDVRVRAYDRALVLECPAKGDTRRVMRPRWALSLGQNGAPPERRLTATATNANRWILQTCGRNPVTPGERRRHRIGDHLYGSGLPLTGNCRGIRLAAVAAEHGFEQVTREYSAQSERATLRPGTGAARSRHASGRGELLRGLNRSSELRRPPTTQCCPIRCPPGLG